MDILTHSSLRQNTTAFLHGDVAGDMALTWDAIQGGGASPKVR